MSYSLFLKHYYLYSNKKYSKLVSGYLKHIRNQKNVSTTVFSVRSVECSTHFLLESIIPQQILCPYHLFITADYMIKYQISNFFEKYFYANNIGVHFSIDFRF